MATNIYRVHGAPDSATFGNVGDMYIDLAAGSLYQCIGANVRGRDYGYITVYSGEGGNTEYVWAKVGGGGGSKMFDDFIEGNATEISSDAKTIRMEVFYGCAGLTSVNFPVCTEIHDSAFELCDGLTSANFQSCRTTGSRVFAGCTNLTSVIFPVCTRIGGEAFGECVSLTSVSFPACTNVDGLAFANCTNLHTVDFPEVVSIGPGAFAGCTNLKSVILRASSVCTIDVDVFPGYGTTSSPMVYVPSSMLSAYSKADGWSAMYNLGRIQAIESMS